MTSKVVLLSTAENDLSKVPQAARVRIAVALRELAGFPASRQGIKKLKLPFEGFRKRVGDYRILFDFELETVFIYRIKNRKDAYR
jgi:mRNA-degrading endonuclease RelE of RelBE toxin-antitoxin system